MRNIIVLTMLLAATASADTPPGPGAEMTELKKFAGVWTCTGKGVSPVDKSAQTYTSKVTIDAPKELGGFWMHLRYDKAKSKEGGPAFYGDGMLGFDSVSSKYYFTGVDANGGWLLAVGTLNSGTLELSGNTGVGGHSAPIKYVLAVNDKKLTMSVDIAGANVAADDCKK